MNEMNKEQFLEIVRGWMNQATQDVAHQVSHFIESMNTSIEELADALDMSADELDAIAMGQAEMTLEQFAKLLIGTNHVIEIKPLSAAPRGFERQHPSMRGGIPRRSRLQHVDSLRRPSANARPFGGMPTPPPMGTRPPMPRGGMMPPPPMGGFPMPPMGARQQMSQQEEEAPQAEGRNFDELSRLELINLIRQNHWDGEINTASASRGQLIDFLEEKFGIATPPQMREAQPTPQRTEQANGVAVDAAEARKARLMEMLNRAVSEHPELLDTIEQYMPQA